MEAKHEETSMILGISIPLDSSEKHEWLKEVYSANKQHLNVSIAQLKFTNLIHSLDPNLGIIGQLPASNIAHEKSTLNSWNIEPHFLHILPLSTSSSNENSILVFGGLNPSSVSNKMPPDLDNDDFVLGSTIFQYILDSGIWKYYGTMIEPRCYHACALDGQYLYVTGGYSLLKRNHGEMLAISSTDRLNLNDRQWKNCSDMVKSRAAHALVSHKGYLYAFGGRNSQGSILASVEMYDPDQDLWIEITSLPQPTMGLSATCIMDSIWLIGGITDHTSKDSAECLLSNVFSYIPSVNKWCEEVPLPYACAFSSCISNDCALWLIGGCTTSRSSKEDDAMISCSTVLQLSLSNKPKWKSVASLLYPRHALTAVLHDEYIYVFGGIESVSKCTCDKVELINTIGNVSAMCTKMPVPIVGCTSVLIIPEKDNSPHDNINDVLQNYRYTDEVSDAYSTFSDKTNFKADVGNYYSSESSKTSSTLQDIYNEDRHNDLPSMPQLHTESFKETFSKKTEKVEIPVEVTEDSFAGVSIDQENLKVKDVLNSEINKSKAKSNKNFGYRTSMEIFLDSDDIGPYALKRKPSQASKWLDYLQKLSLSDEKLHKEVFQLNKPKVNVKTEIDNTDVKGKLKSTEVKYFEKDRNLDPLSSAYEESSLSSHHKSFMYVKSNIKMQPEDLNLDQGLDNEKKETSEDIAISHITDLKLDNLDNDIPDETKITINEDSFPVILLIGGEYSKRPVESRFIISYSCNENAWKYIGYMPEYRCYHCAVFVNKRIYVIGGFRSEASKFNENITNKTMYYDFCDMIWHDAANTIYPRAYHSAAVLKDKIYVLGGRDQFGRIISSVEIYDVSADVWKESVSIPYPILGAASFSLNDSIYVFGGITYEDDEIISSKTAIFDTKKNSWVTGFKMPIPLAFCGIAKNLKSVWLFGGLKIEGSDLVSSKDIFKSDIFTKTWSKVAELSTPRLASVTVSIGSKVYVIGGHSTQEKKEVLICEVLDLTKNEISLLKSLPIGISGKAGTAITEENRTETNT